jgi:hypothetical protein
MTNSEHAHSAFLRAFARAVDELRRERGLSEAELDAFATSGETDPGTLRALGTVVSEFRRRAGLSVRAWLLARTCRWSTSRRWRAAWSIRAWPPWPVANAIGVPVSDLASRAKALEEDDKRKPAP